MSEVGHKRTLRDVRVMSALPPKVDIHPRSQNVRFVPKAAIKVMDCLFQEAAESPHAVKNLRRFGAANAKLRASGESCSGARVLTGTYRRRLLHRPGLVRF